MTEWLEWRLDRSRTLVVLVREYDPAAPVPRGATGWRRRGAADWRAVPAGCRAQGEAVGGTGQ